ncbi:hypothetical protein [Rhodococcoides corynebacterioides]|uniref:Uncharacterized protein n=1 Tax=Rhodococcoides corynebacterioides TaxID=53972 RepID=A0ABS7P829_9NOCA|nr:hypothetical protein [Rhodococcus corynebacterioides]MBY6368569.1 hypothetical protein [Rhodococcus corynebacterioides]MBY6409656.1 hypothetical protein [Rhodococcus corynebacterioides]
MSTGLVRGVTVTGAGELLEVTERPVSLDRALDNACDAALELAAAAGHDAPVMAIGGDPEDWVGRGGVRLIGECDAFLAAARVEGCVDDVRVVAVVDAGRVGTRVHVLDTMTGRLISSVGTDEFSGDGLTMAVTSYLWSTYGAAERGSAAEMAGLAAAADRAVRMLGTERAVDLSGPFVTDPVRLRRTEFDAIVADCASRVQFLIDDAVRLGAQAVLVVGGCAESASLPAVLAARTAAPVRVPRHPAAFSAAGAAHLSTVIPSARPFAAPRSVPAQRVPVATRSEPTVPATTAAADHVGPADSAPAAHAAPGRRRSPRVAAVAGTAALVAVATLGAAAGASERESIDDVRATDRAVATSAVAPADAPGQTRPQGVVPAATDTTTRTTAPAGSTTETATATGVPGTDPAASDIAATVPPGSTTTTSTDPNRRPVTTAPGQNNGNGNNGGNSTGNGPVRNPNAGGGGRDTTPTRDRDDESTSHAPVATPTPATPKPITTTTPRPTTTAPAATHTTTRTSP